jgi:single-stranded-DNA-specific exonuclease
MEKRWQIRPNPNETIVNNLATALGGAKHKLLATLLLQRGISTYEQARDFFNPDLGQIHDPFLMVDMDKAVTRLQAAINNNEQILVFGDYDVDGTTSVALVYHFLNRFYSRLHYYVPDRYQEGYGISDASIEYAKTNGITLIIALDCGIKSVDKIAYAKTLGIDYIVCDHHLPGPQLPPAIAVLDAKRADCNYPFKELSGCGVGFKLLQAWCIKQGSGYDMLLTYLDLLAISVAADIVPIVGENRVFCAKGLELINLNPRPGTEALLRVAGFAPTLEARNADTSENGNPNRVRNLNITNIVFGLAPRINAAGRMLHAKAAVALMINEDVEAADELALAINRNNSERRDEDARITKTALEMIATDYPDTRSTVLYNPTWRKGIIGIVASRCIEHYFRPTIILTESGGKVVGSARSVPGFDLYDAISQCADLLEQYGGHTHAAGLTLLPENLDAFRAKFEEIAQKSLLSTEQTIPVIDIDQEVPLSELSYTLGKNIKRMGPFGPGNMHPIFLSKNVMDNGAASRIKSRSEGGADHLKMHLFTKGMTTTWEAIAFGKGELFPAIARGQKMDICYTFESNMYMGRETYSLNIKDIRVAEE